ncbi:hypothetical protein LJR042_000044 [Microbacterium maritypicum]|uniref:hypothetical protein n=1 Tax=Microbacterium maritypicum TaxID=33918 RepID=UPI003ECEECF2
MKNLIRRPDSASALSHRPVSRKALIGFAFAASAAMVLGTAMSADARTLSNQVLSHEAGSTGVQADLGDQNTYMTGTAVWHFDSLQPTRTYCGAQARHRGTLANGSAWSRTFGYESVCNFVQVQEGTTVNQYMKWGAKFTGEAYHDQAWATGTAVIYP